MQGAAVAATLVILATIGCEGQPAVAAGGSAPLSQPAAVDLRGAPVDALRDADASAIALIFFDAECPVAQRLVPTVNRLFDELSSRGVRFWLVYPEGTGDAIRAHVAEFGIRVPVLRDPAHSLVARAGVTVTPEAAVFTRDGHLRYRGRVDDRQVSLGSMRPVPTQEDLREALEAVLQRRLDTFVETPGIGCYIRGVP